jgi:hypothetical protein
MSIDEEPEQEHHGWEVEYLSRTGDKSQTRTSHPSARSYELVSDRNETTPTLVLRDEEEDAIAVYNGLSWVACRRIAKARHRRGRRYC